VGQVSSLSRSIPPAWELIQINPVAGRPITLIGCPDNPVKHAECFKDVAGMAGIPGSNRKG